MNERLSEWQITVRNSNSVLFCLALDSWLHRTGIISAITPCYFIFDCSFDTFKAMAFVTICFVGVAIYECCHCCCCYLTRPQKQGSNVISLTELFSGRLIQILLFPFAGFERHLTFSRSPHRSLFMPDVHFNPFSFSARTF